MRTLPQDLLSIIIIHIHIHACKVMPKYQEYVCVRRTPQKMQSILHHQILQMLRTNTVIVSEIKPSRTLCIGQRSQSKDQRKIKDENPPTRCKIFTIPRSQGQRCERIRSTLRCGTISTHNAQRILPHQNCTYPQCPQGRIPLWIP